MYKYRIQCYQTSTYITILSFIILLLFLLLLVVVLRLLLALLLLPSHKPLLTIFCTSAPISLSRIAVYAKTFSSLIFLDRISAKMIWKVIEMPVFSRYFWKISAWS